VRHIAMLTCEDPIWRCYLVVRVWAYEELSWKYKAKGEIKDKERSKKIEDWRINLGEFLTLVAFKRGVENLAISLSHEDLIYFDEAFSS